MPFYRDYLSKFTLSHLFRDKPLLTKSENMLSKADGDLLLKLVCGSLSSTYHITYNEEKEGLDLAIHAVKSDNSVSAGKLEELWLYQINSLFELYLNEQLSLEYCLKNNIDKDFLEENRGIRLVVFEQKMRALEENYRQRKNDNEDIDAELDELLRS